MMIKLILATQDRKGAYVVNAADTLIKSWLEAIRTSHSVSPSVITGT